MGIISNLNTELQNPVSDDDIVGSPTAIIDVCLAPFPCHGIENIGPDSNTDFTFAGTLGSSALSGDLSDITVEHGLSPDALIGALDGVDVDIYDNLNADALGITVVIGGVAYTNDTVDANGAAFTLNLVSAAGDQINIANVQNNFGDTELGLEGFRVRILEENIEADLAEVIVYQLRDFATNTGNIDNDSFDSTVLEGLNGGDFSINSSELDTVENEEGSARYDAPAIGLFNVIANMAGPTLGVSISAKVDGAVYRTLDGFFDDITDLDTARNGENSTLGGDLGVGVIRLYKEGDEEANPNDYFEIRLAGGLKTTGLDLNSSENADLLEAALNAGFQVW